MSSWLAKSPPMQALIQQAVQANTNENIKAQHYWPFVGETIGGFHSRIASNAENVSIIRLHITMS